VAQRGAELLHAIHVIHFRCQYRLTLIGDIRSSLFADSF